MELVKRWLFSIGNEAKNGPKEKGRKYLVHPWNSCDINLMKNADLTTAIVPFIMPLTKYADEYIVFAFHLYSHPMVCQQTKGNTDFRDPVIDFIYIWPNGKYRF